MSGASGGTLGGKAWGREGAKKYHVGGLTRQAFHDRVPPMDTDTQTFITRLTAVAGRHLPERKIYVERTQDDTLWRRSFVGWQDGQATRLKAYHHEPRLLPFILAHEVGHLETMASVGGMDVIKSSPRTQYHAEAMASRWGLAFLRTLGIDEATYKEGAEVLQGCLDRYKPAKAVRYVLTGAEDVSYQQSVKGVQRGKVIRRKSKPVGDVA